MAELPEGTPVTKEKSEQWNVYEIRVRRDDVQVTDILLREGVRTSEIRHRVLTDQEVADLFATGAKKTFKQWCVVIHGNAE